MASTAGARTSVRPRSPSSTVKYLFPPEFSGEARGMPTAWAARPLPDEIALKATSPPSGPIPHGRAADEDNFLEQVTERSGSPTPVRRPSGRPRTSRWSPRSRAGPAFASSRVASALAAKARVQAQRG